MCELAARHFLSNGAKEILVTNRTYEKALSLAEEFNGRAMPFEEMFEHLHEADIVLTSTGAPTTIMGPMDLEPVIKRRKMQPMFLIDIAVPRDIDPAVNELESIYLYDMDDLQQVVASNLEGRRQEADKAEAIISEEIHQFTKWVATLNVTPTIVALRKRLEEIRRSEVEKSLQSWKDAPDGVERRLDALTVAIMNKLLHNPINVLKKTGQGNRNDLYVDALSTLFELGTAESTDDALYELEES